MTATVHHCLPVLGKGHDHRRHVALQVGPRAIHVVCAHCRIGPGAPPSPLALGRDPVHVQCIQPTHMELRSLKHHTFKLSNSESLPSRFCTSSHLRFRKAENLGMPARRGLTRL